MGEIFMMENRAVRDGKGICQYRKSPKKKRRFFFGFWFGVFFFKEIRGALIMEPACFSCECDLRLFGFQLWLA